MCEYIPIPNQKFEIGRTINLSRCDCEVCNYMNCPKNNYALKMRKRVFKVADFWEAYKDKILKVNVPYKWQYNMHDKFHLHLTYDLITEFIDRLFNFPEGTYWSPEDCLTYSEKYDIFDSVYETIMLQKMNRKGIAIDLGSIRISDGEYTDFDLSEEQEKLAIRISKALKELKELIFDYYESKEECLVGWLSPEGKHYKCGISEHSILAYNLNTDEIRLENMGYVKIFTNDSYISAYNHLSAEQRNWLSLHGFMLDD